MNTDDCSICFEAFTPDSGHSVLGCGHKFHLMCVVRWFQDQEGASTCPCCRRESGRLDNVPLVEEAEGDADGAEDGDEDGESEWEEYDDDDEEEVVGDLRPVWTWDATHRIWERSWVVTGGSVSVWDPAGVGEDAEEAPEEMVDGAVALQRIWRGWCVRRSRCPVREAEAEVTEAARILVTIKNVPATATENSWHYQRFLRVD
jgi:hypothetical protein